MVPPRAGLWPFDGPGRRRGAFRIVLIAWALVRFTNGEFGPRDLFNTIIDPPALGQTTARYPCSNPFE